MPAREDLTGRKVRGWVVVRFGGSKMFCGRRRPTWVLRCECGTEMTSFAQTIRQKNGIARKCLACRAKSRTTIVPEWNAWKMMRQRCNNPNSSGYENYGGRGVRVCNRWDSFRVFLEDMGERPSENHSLDRIDNGGDYCPENCRWATRREQNYNRRTSISITHNGRTLNLSQWAAELGMNYGTLRNRLCRGWSVTDTLTKPSCRNPVVGNRVAKQPE